MELPKALPVMQRAPQNQIMVYQNTTVIVTQTIVKNQHLNPPNNLNFSFIVAAVLFLALGFLLGIGAMFVFSRRKKLKSKDKKNSNATLNDSQKSTAESENSKISSKNDRQGGLRSSSTESSPALDSSPGEKQTLQDITLESQESKYFSNKLECNMPDPRVTEPPEMRIVPLSNNVSENHVLRNREISYGSNESNEFSKNSSEIGGDKKEQLLQLKIKQQFSQTNQHAEVLQIDKLGKFKLHENAQDIHSYQEESEIQVHETDGKIVKIEKTVNTTVYTERKTEELKELINKYTSAIESNESGGSTQIIPTNQMNRLALPSFEVDQKDSFERKVSPEFELLHRNSSPGPKPSTIVSTEEQPQNMKRQSNPADLNEERRIKEDNKIGLLSSTPSPMKSMSASQAFPHLTGFFEKVFGDKTLIGRGGFGEVYKVTHKLEQKLYAVKKVKLFVKDGEDIRQNKLFREVFAMTSLHHPHIVRHHTTWTEEPPSDMNPKQILRKSLSNRKLTMIKKSQESFTSAADHTKISDLGFQWEVSNKEQRQNSKSQKVEIENDSDSEEESESYSRIKTISQVQASMLEEDKSDEEVLSVLNASIINKLKDHQLIYLFMQMEYCSGDSLMNFLENRRTHQNKYEIVKIFKQILEGVIAIHENGILHRDLKYEYLKIDHDSHILTRPSNIFFEKGFVKIGDFGLSWLGEQQEDDLEPTLNLSSKEELKFGKSNSYTSNIGTPFYISPEQEKSTLYDSKTDIYSLGIILFELISFFKTRHERGEKIKALREQGQIEPQVREEFTDFSKLVLDMTDKNPEKRPSAKETLAILQKTVSSPEKLSLN